MTILHTYLRIMENTKMLVKNVKDYGVLSIKKVKHITQMLEYITITQENRFNNIDSKEVIKRYRHVYR
ncbi:hypothetical protein qdsa001_199 [Staphylococcus phage qdsa001]|nr:hypothetical protein qdsa001_199 [Staphylococcus phage qdsa001]